MTTSTTNKREGVREAAFSLVEAMVVLAVLSTIVSISIFSLSSVHEGTAERKLTADIASLNAAIGVYEANGGNLLGITDVSEVITHLKKESSNGIEIAGLRGQFIDPRLDIVMISEGKSPRAVWNPLLRRFSIENYGTGVAQFYMNHAAGAADYGSEEREVQFDLAKVDDWVWDYTDRGVTGSVRPSNIATLGGPTGPSDPTTDTASQLQPPIFSQPGKNYDYESYNLEVHLLNPNPGGVSRIMYSLVAGEWNVYSGGAIELTPNSSLEAYAESVQTSQWTDSTSVLEYYGVISTPMEITLAFAKPAYTYKELGGSMISGATGLDPNANLAAPGLATLVNVTGGVGYLQSGDIELRSRFGSGIEELIVVEHGSTSGEISLNPGDFGAHTSVVVEARAVSHVSHLDDSETLSTVLAVDPVQIKTPVIVEQPRPDGLFVYGEHYVEINLDTASGDIPEGARVYYTTDGSDPGESHGNPTSPAAILYEGPFLIEQPDGLPIKARVYSPTGNEQWFVASDEEEIEWPLVANVGFTVSVSTNPPPPAGSSNTP